ncbi:MAG: hypothetical protein KGO96_12745 [Elusimicrobia bacterium]|nr:hypothetical protein [Elusimicrobiota bacterium]
MTRAIELEVAQLADDVAKLLRAAFGDVADDIQWRVQYLGQRGWMPYRIQIGAESDSVANYWGSDAHTAYVGFLYSVEVAVRMREARKA